MKIPRHRALLLGLLLCFTSIWLGGCGEPGAPNITATLRGQSSYQIGKPVEVTFTLSNASSADLYVLKWELPYEGFKSMFYVVEKDGVKLEYKGRTATRSEPTKDEYLKISFGEISLITLDISQVFDLSQPGTYTLQLATNIVDYTWNGDEIPRSTKIFQGYTLKAEPITFKME